MEVSQDKAEETEESKVTTPPDKAETESPSSASDAATSDTKASVSEKPPVSTDAATSDTKASVSEKPPVSTDAATSDASAKKKKVNKMNLDEVKAAIKKTEEHMKGLTSKYAKRLCERQNELEKKAV